MRLPLTLHVSRQKIKNKYIFVSFLCLVSSVSPRGGSTAPKCSFNTSRFFLKHSAIKMAEGNVSFGYCSSLLCKADGEWQSGLKTWLLTMRLCWLSVPLLLFCHSPHSPYLAPLLLKISWKFRVELYLLQSCLNPSPQIYHRGNLGRFRKEIVE